MILIATDNKLNIQLLNSVEALGAFHNVEIIPISAARGMVETIRGDVYDSVFRFDESEFESLRRVLPRRKKFRLNCKQLLNWQRERRGFIRPAFGFSDSRKAQRIMKRAGFLVGKLDDLNKLANKMEAA